MSINLNSGGYTIGTSISDDFPTISITGSTIGNVDAGYIVSNGSSGSWNWGTITSADTSLSGATLHVKGDADFEGEVSIKGKNIADMFAKIEERLAILHPNPKLEEKWERLKSLGQMYRELEAEIIEKEKMWDILKK
jgi:hypothetical protein